MIWAVPFDVVVVDVWDMYLDVQWHTCHPKLDTEILSVLPHLC